MPAITPFEHAAAELHAAADIAADRAGGNPFDPWSSLAGTLRLVAAGLDPMPPSTQAATRDVHDHLRAALEALDPVPREVTPGDVTFWLAHIVDLAGNARDLDATPLATSKSDRR